MKFLLECVILEITEKHFRNREGAEQSYYVANVYQPGGGVAEITIEKNLAESGIIKSGARSDKGIFTVEIRNGKPRITGIVK